MSSSQSDTESSMRGSATGRGGPDPLRTLAHELEEQEQRQRARQQQQQQQQQHQQSHYPDHVSLQPTPSPPRGFDMHPQQQTFQYADTRSSSSNDREFAQSHSHSSAAAFAHPELRALSDTMRSLSMPSAPRPFDPSYPSAAGAVGGMAQSQGPRPSAPPAEYCGICEQEEANMNQAQRRHHEQHHGSQRLQQDYAQQRAQSFAANYPPTGPYDAMHAPMSSSFGAGGGFHSAASTQPLSSSQRGPPPPAAATAAPFMTSPQRFGSLLPPPQAAPVVADESLLYTSQPSRAVLSALRTLQDKLAELRLEKSNLENELSRTQAASAARESEAQRAHERALAESVRRAAEFEANYLSRLREAREETERAQANTLRLEHELRASKEQLSLRDRDTNHAREECQQLRLRVNELELNGARAQGEQSKLVREMEGAREAAEQKEGEIAALKDELSSAREHATQLTQQLDQSRTRLGELESSHAQLESQLSQGQHTLDSLGHELRVVSTELLHERHMAKALEQFKFLVREYAASLLNLNYELCIDIGMVPRKRNEILQHAQQLLQGLKKAAWSAELEEAGAGAAGADGHGDGEQTSSHADSSANQHGSPVRNNARGSGSGSGVVIDGVSTGIDQQRYLLAGASSPEAIRVLHPTRDGDEEDEEGDEGGSDTRRRGRSTSRGRTGTSSSRASSRGPTSSRVSAAPTVSSTAKSRAAAGSASHSSTQQQHHHVLNQEIALPFTVGKSAKQSFSVPVNVQEILAKQPAYYTRLAQRQVAQAAKRKSGAGGSASQQQQRHSDVDDDRLVYPPLPTHGLSSFGDGSAESSLLSGAPVPLSAHSLGLRTVISHLEGEVEQLNRDYVFHLDNGVPRGGGADSDNAASALQRKLKDILKQIDFKNQQIQTLKSHLESVDGSASVRLYSASTAASRSGRASTSTSALHKASVPLTLVPSGGGPRSAPSHSIAPTARRASLTRSSGSRPTSSSMKKRASGAPHPHSHVASHTDLTDRHAHHQHGTQSHTPSKRRGGLRLDDDEDGEEGSVGGGGPLPQFGFLSPNSQRLLQKKMHSMRLLGQFKALFDESEHNGRGGDAARRFGAD